MSWLYNFFTKKKNEDEEPIISPKLRNSGQD
jgi:hypothetical protein